jgi:hypothetical protein
MQSPLLGGLQAGRDARLKAASPVGGHAKAAPTKTASYVRMRKAADAPPWLFPEVCHDRSSNAGSDCGCANRAALCGASADGGQCKNEVGKMPAVHGEILRSDQDDSQMAGWSGRAETVLRRVVGKGHRPLDSARDKQECLRYQCQRTASRRKRADSSGGVGLM